MRAMPRARLAIKTFLSIVSPAILPGHAAVLQRLALFSPAGLANSVLIRRLVSERLSVFGPCDGRRPQSAAQFGRRAPDLRRRQPGALRGYSYQ